MLFTTSSSQKSYINNIIDKTKNNQPIFSITNRIIRNPVPIPTQVIPQEFPIQIQPKKMKWGEPTWFLFHVLAEKIKNEYFSLIRVDLLNTIYTICANLPCPDCADHATAYLNGINFKTIQTKEQLKYMLYTFHNTVNAKKGFDIFPISELDNKYSQMDLLQTIYTFMPFFQDKSRSIRMIANDFHRSRTVEHLKNWFNANIIYFDR
jgi:hypothetical protein